MTHPEHDWLVLDVSSCLDITGGKTSTSPNNAKAIFKEIRRLLNSALIQMLDQPEEDYSLLLLMRGKKKTEGDRTDTCNM